MKRSAVLFTIMILVLANLLLIAPVGAADFTPGTAPIVQVTGKVIPNHYIVVLKDSGVTGTVMSANHVAAKYVYDAALRGFAGELNAGQLKALQRDPSVAYIEPDQVATIDTTQSNPPWGLDRIDQHNLPLSNSYTYNATASNVYAYIIDTGIQTSHPDFGGRAAVAFDALGGNGQDCNGHGTHVSGTVGGTTYGVAKAVNLRAVRVLDCSGSGSYAQVIAGVNWVTSNHSSPAVANMSLGGSLSSALNSAVTSMINSGVYTAVAAGNSNANACKSSPASTASAYTTAASDSTDHRASFSNKGRCVDGYAPGVNIPSDWLNSGTNTISGTSMASPHVAGVAALYKSTNTTASATTITNWINSNATSGVIIGNPSGTPNLLLYKSTL
jgi:subtilisin family serine protease